MPDTAAHPLPADALLQRYATKAGNYTDCFCCHMDGIVTLPQFVTAFYTAPLFRSERVILRFAVNRPSTDEDAVDVAHGATTRFSAWDVEDRTETQLLMCDLASKTRSWFMTRPHEGGTHLFFGSAVTPNQESETVGLFIKATTWLHVAYSHALLKGAAKRLSRGPTQAAAR
ncbi:MAG: hypothetical protein ABJN34_00305 [Litoreibacter sp.]|uniref:hypothetical protein n=1 Tax=Litoreibacter sp. TaxID=1969459 RepID=UPI003298F226